MTKQQTNHVTQLSSEQQLCLLCVTRMTAPRVVMAESSRLDARSCHVSTGWILKNFQMHVFTTGIHSL